MPKSMYPRPTFKKILKAQSNRAISKDVDILVFLKYTLFMQALLDEARIETKKAGGSSGGGGGAAGGAITARSVRKVREGVLRKFKG
ncbi:hypothetical protein DM02DRAFT_602261 [Periconia macrospinosa]|uniref:Transcription factor CBF/NF-Y/archaeal histone domain-containing protein n=1 Tax=Periconia macrospinosa TaxID=97972 RepID=A0A2V1D943_9PLEO|nr:hypothetical protein DM02DRAFT_602261 [Periconia macrospinosa]